MGQKINPFGYRLGITENHRSKWFSLFQGLRHSSNSTAMNPTRYHTEYSGSSWVNASLATAVAK